MCIIVYVYFLRMTKEYWSDSGLKIGVRIPLQLNFKEKFPRGSESM